MNTSKIHSTSGFDAIYKISIISTNIHVFFDAVFAYGKTVVILGIRRRVSTHNSTHNFSYNGAWYTSAVIREMNKGL